MERYLVKINELNDKNRYIKDIILQIEDSVTNIKNLERSIRWVSPAKDKLMVKYTEYIDYLNKMTANLKTCLKVTEKYHDNYSNGYQEIKKSLRDVASELEEKKDE